MAAPSNSKPVMKEFQLQHFFCFVFFFALLSTPLTCNAQIETVEFYRANQLDALQSLLGAWNDSTPDMESNLPGWNSSQKFPCSEENQGWKRWHGVQCLKNVSCSLNLNSSDGLECKVFITGLSLDNASIVGILPSAIGIFRTLYTLELTNNPKLTGTLPPKLLDLTNLFTLDLHGNGLHGEIPDLKFFRRLHEVNLAANRFTGIFPVLSQAASYAVLNILNLSRNDLEGGLPDIAFKNVVGLVQVDLSNNRFNGTLPTLSTMVDLQVLDLSNNRFSGTLPDLRMMRSLHFVNLSSNAFTGSNLDSWNSSNPGGLQELYLDNNLLNETLDITKLFKQGLFSTRSLKSVGQLRVLSLMNNSIHNVRYSADVIENIATAISLQGNPYCNSPDFDDGTRCFCKQECIIKDGSNDRRKAVIIAVVSSVSSLLVLMIVLAALLYRNRRYKRYLQLHLQQKFEEFEVKPTIFHYNQLRTATRDFHPDLKLGQGAFGAVYKGILPNGTVVAVKQLFAKSTQGIDEFLNEVVLLTGMKHRNLVNLKGCCIRDQQKLLVYEYVDNYDVEKVLLSPNKVLLSWPVRLKICLGVARGLHYLHAFAHPKIIHRDIKASNVLLAKNYDTKIADFGVASLFPDEESYIMTKHVAGTKGYLAPEYASYGQLSDKVDVFSFGVLCLEVVSGRRNIDGTLPPEEICLSKWVWDLLQRDSLMDLVDQTMSLQDNEKLEVQRLINVALLCIQIEAEQRPSMERVVAMLQGDTESEAVVLKPSLEEQYFKSINMFGVGKSGLGTLKEESSFMSSSRRGCSEDDSSTNNFTLEPSEIKVDEMLIISK